MLQQQTLTDLVQQKIHMGPEGNGGWRALRCMACNDHSPRGAFKFENDSVLYNCFNCASKMVYQEGSGKLTKKAKEILESFGITRDEMRKLTSSMFLEKQEETSPTLEELTKPKIFTPEVAWPENCLPLVTTEGYDELQNPLLEYLLGRNIDPVRTQFYFSTSKKLIGRVIIPYFRNGKLIYWQARHIDSSIKPRYLNCAVAKDAVMYGYDRLHAFDETPLFVTEGVFNAILVNGIAIMSSDLNAAKIEVLKKTRRRLIFIRDRDANGDKLSQQVLENGWEVTTTDSRVGDVNDSINRFGAAYTAYSLIKNAQKPENKVSSSINIGLWGLEDRLKKLGGK